MRVLGLDLSLRSTGYVLLDDDEVVWHGTVGSETLREEARLAMFDGWIRESLQRQRVRPVTSPYRVLQSFNAIDHAAIEGYAYAAPHMLPALGELGGVVKLALFQAGIPIHVVAPGTWKKVLCGNGRLDKKDAAVEIYKRYQVEYPRSQDTLDAWAVAMCCRRQLLGLDKPEPKVRKRKSLPLLEVAQHVG